MKKIIITSISLAFCSLSSMAANTSALIDLSDKTIQITSDPYTPRVYVNGAELDGAALGCDNDTPVISLGKDNEQAEMMYNTLLSAKKSGQKVLLTAKSCWSGYSTPLVYSITTY